MAVLWVEDRIMVMVTVRFSCGPGGTLLSQVSHILYPSGMLSPAESYFDDCRRVYDFFQDCRCLRMMKATITYPPHEINKCRSHYHRCTTA